MALHTPERDEALIAFADTLPVYFAFSDRLRLVKIGFSTNVRQRLLSIPADRPEAGRLSLVGWLIGGPQLEAELHDRFADHRERGEWFHPVPEMADLIDEDGQEGEPPVLSLSGFHVSARGYWAARRRLAMTEEVERVVLDFGGGRVLRTVDVVPVDRDLLARSTSKATS